MRKSSGRRRVVLLELNEITSTILEPMMSRGRLPSFQRLRREGAWAQPESVDLPPHLDPWVTWITVHTGVDRGVHGATVLGQDAATIRAKRTWQYAAEAGRSVGVFGSFGAHPPEPVPGFIVPGPFSPGSETYPPYLEPIQELNRAYTQIHGKNRDDDSVLDMARRALELCTLGLEPSACAAAAAQLARELLSPHQRWRRVTLQPRINYGFFEMLYRRYQPDYATWHTNHAAHLMHHYWRAMDDSKFLAPAAPDEKRKYGGAVELGYELCDELLGRFMRLVDPDTTLVVASSMGQQPYVSELFPGGRIVVRIRDIRQLVRLVGAEGVTEAVPAMAPQWCLRVPDARARARTKHLIESAYRVGAATREAFSVNETGEILTLSTAGLASPGEVRYFFPDAPDADPRGYPLDALFALDTATPKEGMHHPRGVLGLWGGGVHAGRELADTTNLDIAPTLLALLGVPVPAMMTGRVLREAWAGAPARAWRAEQPEASCSDGS